MSGSPPPPLPQCQHDGGDGAALGEAALASQPIAVAVDGDELAVEPDASGIRAVEEACDGQQLGEAFAEEGKRGAAIYLVTVTLLLA